LAGLSGVFSQQGRSREEARRNGIDALRSMLSPEPTRDDDDVEREQAASDDRRVRPRAIRVRPINSTACS
jgi:hypothetical protein